MKTPLTYYGGKQRLVDIILPLIPPHKTYVEPFCGGAAIFFAKPRSETDILNDTNGNILNFYKVLRNHKTKYALQRLINDSLHAEALHQKSKDIWFNPGKHTNVTKAWACWYQCNFSFAKKPGDAFARSDAFGTRTPGKHTTFNDALNHLNNVTLYNDDALNVLKRHNKSTTFAYIDPPYFNAKCAHYDTYTKTDFQNLLTTLTQFNGKFLLSSYNSEILTQFSKDNNWNTIEIKQNVSIDAKRNINNIKTKIEILTFNYNKPQSILF